MTDDVLVLDENGTQLTEDEAKLLHVHVAQKFAAAFKREHPMLPRLEPRVAHPDDLKHALVIGKLPPAGSGIVVEQLFSAPGPVGWYETPRGVRVQIVVDPAMAPGAWRLEHAVTGEIVNGGMDFRRGRR